MPTAETTPIALALAARLLLACAAVAAADDGGSSHWAYTPASPPAIPEVADKSWPQQPLDHFVLAKLEAAGLKPASRAGRRQLIRRAYFDLIGLPPTPTEVRAFLADEAPDALAKVVDALLASPRYGERWGRHWLDVARYGDSNGGDENHAYPHAWRYRNYVIDAFNRDLPYDEFVREQLAGDLIESSPADAARRVTATGFLAIGTKILAEKDPVKKRADIVDEQIDTVSRVFMAMTVACSRCHDHKFDPIPTADYYALAGIFHSTVIGDEGLVVPEDAEREAARLAHIAQLDGKIAAAEEELGNLADTEQRLEWEAEKFARGNVIVDTANYGKGIGIISDPGAQDNFVEYEFEISEAGTYLVELRYAAAASRPGRLILNGDADSALAVLAETTGGWMPQNQRWIRERHLVLAAGKQVVRIESKPMMSHLDKLRLTRVRSLPAVERVLAELDGLRSERGKLAASKPEPAKAMAVKDGAVADAKLNIRGNPHDHGAAVARGFLSQIGAADPGARPSGSSGRLELADWLVQPDHPLTARVMVNRIWRWHFGKGLVASMDNFGTTGSAPTHPGLLDHLARRFVDDGWSIKRLHRSIMLSSTYQMAAGVEDAAALATDPNNTLHWNAGVRRLEAEAFRDAVLAVAGSIDTEPPTAPLAVKMQDPSPAELARNREIYEAFPHRSVYLPVVRSHLYDLMTLLGFPNATTPVGDRARTTVPTQALLMLNSPFLLEQSDKLATAVAPGELDTLYLTLFSRPPSEDEIGWANSFLDRYTALKGADRAWAALCHTLMISDEFTHVW